MRAEGRAGSVEGLAGSPLRSAARRDPHALEAQHRSERRAADRDGERGLGQGAERPVDDLELALVPRRAEDLQRRGRAADQ